MQGLLGKITQIEETDGEYRVTFKPESVLPARTAPPEWLKDQSLTVTRRAPDPREVGRIGDGIVLPADEAGRFLTPLTISPDTAAGEVPKSVTINLAWWKDEKAPDCTVKVDGRSLTPKLVANTDGGFTVDVDLSAIGVPGPTAPCVEVECGGAKAVCAVTPAKPAAVKSIVRGRPHLTVANPWYRVDLATSTNAGGITALTEAGRGLDHFAPPPGLVQPPLEYGGHYEHHRSAWQWHDATIGTAIDVAGSRREGDAVRVSLEACVDEGKNIHTFANYTIFDRMPLVLIQREYRRHKPKEDKPGDPKEPVETVDSFQYSSRSATVAEHGDTQGSRVYTSHSGELICIRPVQYHEMNTRGDMKLVDGWVLAEHPQRRSYMLYLTDRTDPPGFLVWHGFYELAVEPLWPYTVLGPGQSVGLAVGLAVGETGGASANGAWIACRSAIDNGTQQCAVIARLNDDNPATATISLGDHRRDVPMQTAYLTGIGPVQFAQATFEAIRADDPFTVDVDGIIGR